MMLTLYEGNFYGVNDLTRQKVSEMKEVKDELLSVHFVDRQREFL